MKKIMTARQLSMILFMSIIALKFLIFPALTTKYAGRDAYIVVFIMLILEFLVILATILILKANPDLTFKEILTNAFGVVVTKIVFAILFVYFFCKTLFLIKETHNYFLEVIFDELPWLYFTVPLTVFLCYTMTKSIKTLARSIEIMFWCIIIALIIMTFTPLFKTDILNIFPMFEYGFTPTFNGIVYSVFSFGDYLVMFIFMGKVTLSKGSVKTIIWYMLFCIAFVTMFYIVFVSLFGNSGINHTLAVSDISVRGTYPYTQEKLDWITILIWTIVLIFQIGVYSIITKECLLEVYKPKYEMIMIYAIAISWFFLSLALYLNLELVVKIATSTPLVIAIWSVNIIVLLLFFLGYIIYLVKNKKSSTNKVINNKSKNKLKDSDNQNRNKGKLNTTKNKNATT